MRYLQIFPRDVFPWVERESDESTHSSVEPLYTIRHLTCSGIRVNLSLGYPYRAFCFFLSLFYLHPTPFSHFRVAVLFYSIFCIALYIYIVYSIYIGVLYASFLLLLYRLCLPSLSPSITFFLVSLSRPPSAAFPFPSLASIYLFLSCVVLSPPVRRDLLVIQNLRTLVALPAYTSDHTRLHYIYLYYYYMYICIYVYTYTCLYYSIYYETHTAENVDIPRRSETVLRRVVDVTGLRFIEHSGNPFIRYCRWRQRNQACQLISTVCY